MKEQNFISAVIYAFNSEDTIKEFIESVELLIHEKFIHYEIIMVNDASTDKTPEMIKSINRLGGHFTLISLPFKHGIEKAMLAGIDRSVGDFVFEFDIPVLCFPIRKIIEAYEEALKNNADIVAVSPKQKLKNSLRRRLFYMIANNVSKSGITLYTESFRIVSRRAINAMSSNKEVIRYRKALYALSGYKYMRLFYDDSDPSVIKRPLNEDFTLALDFLLSYTTLIPRLALLISILFFGFSIFIGCYAIFQIIFNKQVMTGWTSIIIAMSVSFSGVFLFTALLAEYMYRILDEIKGRNRYSAIKVEDLK